MCRLCDFCSPQQNDNILEIRSAGWRLVQNVPAETIWAVGQKETGSSNSSVMVYCKAFSLRLCKKKGATQYEWFINRSVLETSPMVLQCGEEEEEGFLLQNFKWSASWCPWYCRGVWNGALLFEHLLSPTPAPPPLPLQAVCSSCCFQRSFTEYPSAAEILLLQNIAIYFLI